MSTVGIYGHCALMHLHRATPAVTGDILVVAVLCEGVSVLTSYLKAGAQV